MEKQEAHGGCDSMTTVTMKDFTPGMEYPEPPPSYKTSGGKSTVVQVTKILATTGVIIAGMISAALIFSAWLTSSNQVCQFPPPNQQTAESILPPQLLQSALVNVRDLDSAESKVEPKKRKASLEEDSEEDSESLEEPDDTMTLFKLPLELNLHDYLFERGQTHRGPMNCFVEKKKAEEVVDEKAKPLPPLFGLNMSTDPRYLRFTGEKISISCDGDEQRQMPREHQPRRFGNPMEAPHPPHPLIHQIPPQFQPQRPGDVSASSNIPIQVIGPIPLSHHQSPPSLQSLLNEIGGSNGLGQVVPFLIPTQGQEPQSLSIQDIGPIFIPHAQEGGPLSQFLNLPRPTPQIKLPRQAFHEQSNENEVPVLVQASEIRQRALHEPIPIVPRHHFPHVIRPRSTDDKKEVTRMKRCACDCACNNKIL